MTPQEIAALVRAQAQAQGIDPEWAYRVAKAESAFNPRAVSPVGAQGVMQLMPGTAKELGVIDPFDPRANIDGGVRYLKQLSDRYGGDQVKASAAYNWGMGNVDRKGLERMPTETRNYIGKVARDDDPFADLNPYKQKQDDDPFADLNPYANQPKSQAAVQQGFQPTAQRQSEAVPESLGGRVAASAGSMLTDLGLGAKQVVNDMFLRNKRTSLGGDYVYKKLGYDPEKTKADLEVQVAEKRKLDKPLIDSQGGTTGRILGGVGAAIPTMLIPGGSTLGGTMLTGAGLGAMEPTASGESRAVNAAIGGAGGAAGYLVGKGISAVGSRMAERSASKAAQSEPLRQTMTAAKDAGYVFDPTAVNPSLSNRVLSGIAGKQNLAQRASIKNQEVTNQLAAADIGLRPGQAITKESIAALKKGEPAQVYDAMRGLGEIPASDSYAKALDKITEAYRGASKSFKVKSPVPELVENYRVSKFDSDSAVSAISLLREDAAKAFRAGDTALSKANRGIAAALEEELSKAPNAPKELLDQFRKARTQYAKIYSVEKALNEATGNVNAARIGREFADGKPLSGGLEKIGRTQQAFQKSLATQKGDSMPGISPFDAMTGVVSSGASGNPGFLATMLARPTLQSALLSRPAQALLARPQSSSTMLPRAMMNPRLEELMRYGLLGGALNTPQLPQQ